MNIQLQNLTKRFPARGKKAKGEVTAVQDLTFTVPLSDADTALRVLKENQHRFGGKDITVDTGCAKVSVVGGGMKSNPGVASRMFEALFEANVNIRMISTSEIKISVIIDKADADRAVAAIHDAFIH